MQTDRVVRRMGTVALSTVLFLAACGGDDDGGTTVTQTPTIAVTLGSPTVSVTQGQSGTATINITRGGGYTGAVGLAVSGAPTGVTATSDPTSVPGTSTSGTVTLNVGATVAPGSYPLTITASGTGVTSQTATLTLTVGAAPVTGSFTVALAPTTVTLVQGGTTTSTLNITRAGGFAGAVGIAVSGAPTGLTVTPAATSVTGASVALNVAATATVAPGSYPVTVTASGTGLPNQTATLTVTVTAAQQGSITIAVAPTTVTVPQGGTGSSTLTITRAGGFTGAVGVAVSGAPTGLTVTPASASVTDNSVALNVSAAATVAPGSYPVTVTASGTGVTNATATLTVTVTAAAQAGVTIALSPTTVTVPQGGSGSSTLTVTRTGGFTGAVNVAVTGAPAGLTVSPATADVTGNSVAINAAAAASVAAGSYPVTVTVSGTGITNQTATLTVTVTQVTATGVNFAFCAEAIPLWVGYQSSPTGAWTRATVGANGAVSIPITGTTGAVAYVTQQGTNGYNMTVVYGAASELTTAGASVCSVAPGGKTVTGSVAGLTASQGASGFSTDQATIALGSATTSVSGTAAGGPVNFTLNNVPSGPRDLLATRATTSISATGGISYAVNKAILRRNLNPANGSALAPLDFNGSESFAPATANVTIANAGADLAFPSVAYTTSNGASGTFFSGIGALLGGGTPSATQQYAGVPAAQQAAGDFHQLLVFSYPGTPTSPDPTNFRMSSLYFRTVADRTVTLGAPLSAPTVTLAATTPYPRPRVQLTRQAEYGDGMAATFTQASTTAPRSASLAVLPGYAGGGNWDITLPDLTGAAGFDPTWALRPGTPIAWTVLGYGGISTFIGATPTEGATFRAAGRTGTLTALLRARRPQLMRR